MFWFYVLPLGFLLTQYTITGFDASAHISEETHGASKSAARGVWQSIFYSAVIGWFVLLAITFAVPGDGSAITAGEGYGAGQLAGDLQPVAVDRRLQGGGADLDHRPAVLRPGVSDQRLENVLRVLARPRPPDQAVSKVNANGTPRNAVIAMALAALIITLPALKGNSAGDPFPFAFFAVVSITVIGLYIAYVDPDLPALAHGRRPSSSRRRGTSVPGGAG